LNYVKLEKRYKTLMSELNVCFILSRQMLV